MGKMSKRKRKASKAKKKFKEALNNLQTPKIRIPVPPVGSAFKSKKDYDRSNNKKIIEKELKNEH